MEQFSANVSDFQDSLIDLFFDESELNRSLTPERDMLRGNFQNETHNITDHGSMVKYDASKDWTKTATPMVQFAPPSRQEKMSTVVSSARAIQETGISGFFGSMKANLELKLGLREAAQLVTAKSIGKGLTH